MGNSREMRASRQLTAQIAQFDRSSLLAVLVAAALSPTACHRLPSITNLLRAFARSKSFGVLTASCDDLAPLLELARLADPRTADLEDFVGGDPRLVVTTAADEQRARLHPSGFEHPLLVCDQLRLMQALDPVLRNRFEFGVEDLVDAALTAGSAQLEYMSPAWSDGPPADFTETAYVTPLEVDFAAAMIGERILEADADAPWFRWAQDGPHARALRWATARPAKRLARGGAPFGGFVAAPASGGSFVLPASLMLWSVGGVVADLEHRLRGDRSAVEPLAELRLARAQQVVEALRGLVVEFEEDGSAGLRCRIAMTDRRVVDLRLAGTPKESAEAIRAATGRAKRESAAGTESISVVVTSHIDHLHAQDGVIITSPIPFIAAVTGRSPLEQWAFLEDVAYHEGVDQLFAADLWDLTAAFDRCAAFPPGVVSPDVGGVHVQPSSAAPAWKLAAAWTPFDAVLERCGLGPSHRYPGRELSGEHLAVLSDGQQFLYVSTEPPWILAVPADTSPHSQFLCTLADSLQHAASRLRAFTDLIQAASGLGPPTICMEFTDRASLSDLGAEDGSSDEIAFAFSADECRPVAAVAIEDQFRNEFALRPRQTHDVFGQVIAHLFAALPSPPDQASVDAFLAEWSNEFPLVVAELGLTPTAPTGPPRAELDSTSTAWAARQLAIRLRDHSPIGTVLVGDQAANACRTRLCPALIGVLDNLIAPLDPSLVLELASRELDRAWGSRLARMDSAQLAMSSPWWADQRIDMHAAHTHDGVLSRAAELVIERTVRNRAREGKAECPDVVDWSRAIATAAMAIDFALAVAEHTAGIAEISVGIDDHGRFHLQRFAKDLFDVEAFNHARLPPLTSHAADDPADRSARAEATQLGETEFTSPEFEDTATVALDQSMRTELGFGFQALIATLATAASWEAEDGVCVVTEHSLAASASSWSGVSIDEVARATAFLTLDAGKLRTEPFEYWKLDKRDQRLASRPFAPSEDGMIVFAPHRVMATQQLLATYLSEGRLPWPSRPLAVARSLEELRQQRNKSFESDVADVAQGAGLTVVPNVEAKRLRSAGLPQQVASRIGEVDVLAIDATRSVIWVLEAKDLQSVYGPVELAGNIRKFHDPKGFVPRLQLKLALLEPHADLLAEIGEHPTGIPWTLHAAIVTQHVEPAAFVPQSPIPIVAVHQLEALLLGIELPHDLDGDH